MKTITSQWLEEMNAEFKRQGITDGEQKVELASKKWREDNVATMMEEETDYSLISHHLDKQDAKIESFFLTQTSKDRGYVQPPFVGIYYYYGNFWDIVVPLIFGQTAVNFSDCLRMPPDLKSELWKDKESTDEFVEVCADTIDYGYAIDEVEAKCNSDFSIQLFRSADKHLRATISLLNQEKASSKAIEDARMSVEIFLKAYLSVKENLTDLELRKQIGHNLETAIDRCIANGVIELIPLRGNLNIFPNVEARYQAPELSFGELWIAYRIAHKVGIAVLRDLTKRDCRTNIRRN